MKKSFILLVAFFILGGIFFLIQQKILIVMWGRSFLDKGDVSKQLNNKIALKKKIKLYLKKGEKFDLDEVSIVWCLDDMENLKNITNQWLIFAYQEQMVGKKIALKYSVLSQGGQEAYLNFDQNPFSNDWSIREKWFLVEGLLKTIKEASLKINKIFFLVNNSILEDEHLDFSQGWPLDGFLG